jgi:hypothetical protein
VYLKEGIVERGEKEEVVVLLELLILLRIEETGDNHDSGEGTEVALESHTHPTVARKMELALTLYSASYWAFSST